MKEFYTFTDKRNEPCQTSMIHVAHMNKSFRTHGWVLSHVCMSCIHPPTISEYAIICVNGSCLTCANGSHLTCHLPRMNGSCLIYRNSSCLICVNGSCLNMCEWFVSYMCEWVKMMPYMCEWIIIYIICHIWVGLVTRRNESWWKGNVL